MSDDDLEDWITAGLAIMLAFFCGVFIILVFT